MPIRVNIGQDIDFSDLLNTEADFTGFSFVSVFGNEQVTATLSPNDPFERVVFFGDFAPNGQGGVAGGDVTSVSVYLPAEDGIGEIAFFGIGTLVEPETIDFNTLIANDLFGILQLLFQEDNILVRARGLNGSQYILGEGVDQFEADTIFNDAVNVSGGGGSDFIYGAGGNDELIGGPGDDILRGNGGRDVLEGGRGSDDLIGGASQDILRGGAGNDTLVGGRGDDRLITGAGDRHKMAGGLGADLIVLKEGASRDTIAILSPNDAGVGAGERDRVLNFEPDRDRFVFRDFRQDAGEESTHARLEMSFNPTGTFSGRAAEAIFKKSSLLVDFDGDGAADLEVVLRQVSALSQDNFLA